MKKILSLAIIGFGILIGSTTASASQCGVNYNGYHKPVTRATVVHIQRQNHRVVNYRNQCVRVDGRVTNRERNCLSNRHYQRPAHRVVNHRSRSCGSCTSVRYHR